MPLCTAGLSAILSTHLSRCGNAATSSLLNPLFSQFLIHGHALMSAMLYLPSPLPARYERGAPEYLPERWISRTPKTRRVLGVGVSQLESTRGAVKQHATCAKARKTRIAVGKKIRDGDNVLIPEPRDGIRNLLRRCTAEMVHLPLIRRPAPVPEEGPLQHLVPLQIVCEPELVLFIRELEQVEQLGGRLVHGERWGLRVVYQDGDAAFPDALASPLCLWFFGR